jgi:hypothetical protein
MFVFLIHPQNEPLDTSFQCTRHWYWREYDEKRRAGLAGPERLAIREAIIAPSAYVTKCQFQYKRAMKQL